MFINGLGAVATGLTTIIVLASKFRSGAWVTAILVPTLIILMHSVRKHYTRVQAEMKDMTPLNLSNLEEPVVVIPMAGWNRISEKALRFGLLMSKDVKVVHVHSEDEGHGLEEEWDEKILCPIREKQMHEPELVTIMSNFRFIISPLMDYILRLEAENPAARSPSCCPSSSSATGGRICCTTSASSSSSSSCWSRATSASSSSTSPGTCKAGCRAVSVGCSQNRPARLTTPYPLRPPSPPNERAISRPSPLPLP